MKIKIDKSFEKDVDKIKNKVIKQEIASVIEKFNQAKQLPEINNLKKLKAANKYYRIRIRDYRIGIELEQDVFVFVRFLHRRDIYRYFP